MSGKGIQLDLTPSTSQQHNFYTCVILQCKKCDRLVEEATKPSKNQEASHEPAHPEATR